jgi:hypothetical protein
LFKRRTESHIKEGDRGSYLGGGGSFLSPIHFLSNQKVQAKTQHTHIVLHLSLSLILLVLFLFYFFNLINRLFLCLIYACLDFGWNCKRIIDLVSVKRKSASWLNSIKTMVQFNYIYLRISISLQAHSSDFDSFMIFQPFNTATTLLYLIFIRFLSKQTLYLNRVCLYVLRQILFVCDTKLVFVWGNVYHDTNF